MIVINKYDMISRMAEKPKTILIVEDDKLILDVLRKKFEIEGYIVVTAGDVHSGLEVIKAQRVDLVLLDILLPGGANGFVLLGDIKQNEEFKKIPVVILSNFSEKQDIEKGLRLGAVDFLVKANNTPNKIVERVEQVLASKQ